MGVIIGMMVGYALGTRAGEEGWEEFKDAWKVISTSEEVRDLIQGGLSLARSAVGQAFSAGGDGRRLRPVA
jgi:hypothetical protein